MIEFLRGWTLSLAGIIVFGSLCEMLLPNSVYKKYIKVSKKYMIHDESNSVKVGDVLPVHIAYKDLDINADVKIVSATTNRAGAEFINLNENIANQLLYLNVLLEADNNMIATRINN